VQNNELTAGSKMLEKLGVIRGKFTGQQRSQGTFVAMRSITRRRGGSKTNQNKAESVICLKACDVQGVGRRRTHTHSCCIITKHRVTAAAAAWLWQRCCSSMPSAMLRLRE